jgi:diaminohydroxyphosphoribosylaminopyrimidine deaminase/5-amino-6-(5-phosphoribosylamino)uracil reductase
MEPNLDDAFLRRALTLAAQGIGLASPNPCVGAVVLDSAGNVAGEGFHTYEGRKHAEVIALEQAGGRASGGALYVNLEPCSHQGRTPPCADAVIAAGIHRVVACMQDPNPQVAGAGFERLRAAGIEVEVGLLGDEARALNEAFAHYIRRRQPFVTLKAAATLDGKVGRPPDAAITPDAAGYKGPWITGEAARAHVHQLRHQHDAILVGIGTILFDDPLLTDRSGLPRRRPLLRVVLDSVLCLPPTARIATSVQNDVLVFCTRPDPERARELGSLGVRVETVTPGTDGKPDLQRVLERVGELELTSLLIEGGARVNGAALSGGLVDKLFLYYAPRIFGDADSSPLAAGLNSPLQAHSLRLHRFGEDFAVEAYLHDPYSD